MFHVNPVQKDSNEISSIMLSKNNEKYSRLLSAAVMIGALTVKEIICD